MITKEIRGFTPPNAMTPEELGDVLARLVWESFSDLLAEAEVRTIFRELQIPLHDGVPPELVSEEILIFVLWTHTRALQLAFYGRAPEDLLRSALDALHRAVFEDLAEHGTPPAQLPVLEQRLSVRYRDYYQASQVSDERVGKAALAMLARPLRPRVRRLPKHLHRILTERAIAVANPLRDFLEDVELVTGPADPTA